MAIFLIRHAQAGSRADYAGPDDSLRPLTDEGRHQAAALVSVLGEMGLTEVVSSPYRRCVQTAVPLAAHLGLELIVDDAFAEGPHNDALAMIRKRALDQLAIISHGDIIPGVLEALRIEDDLELGLSPRCQKASIWVLEPAGRSSTFSRATYIAPPRWKMA